VSKPKNVKKKSHHITNSASFTNCGRLLKKKKNNWKLKEEKNVHNSFNFVFCPNLAINWQPLKRKIILAVQ